jgi:hypothetical protein
MQLTHLYPAVSLEHSRYIRSVTCNPTSTSISVTFTDSGAFQTAASDWTTHSQLLLITYSAGCGAGITSQERSFHLVSNIQTSKTSFKITATIDTIPFHETFHEDQDLTFHVASYSMDHSAPPPSRRAPITPAVVNTREAKLENRDFFDFLSDAVSQVSNAALAAANAAGDFREYSRPFSRPLNSTIQWSTWAIMYLHGTLILPPTFRSKPQRYCRLILPSTEVRRISYKTGRQQTPIPVSREVWLSIV